MELKVFFFISKTVLYEIIECYGIHYMELKDPCGVSLPLSLVLLRNPLHGVERGTIKRAL